MWRISTKRDRTIKLWIENTITTTNMKTNLHIYKKMSRNLMEILVLVPKLRDGRTLEPPSPIFLFDPYPLSKPHELTETIIFLKHFWNLCLLKLVTKFSFFFRPVLECWSVHSHLNFDQYKRKINPVQNQQNIYLYLYYNRVHILFWFLLFSFILIEIQATVRVFSVTTGIFRKYPPKHDISVYNAISLINGQLFSLFILFICLQRTEIVTNT